jgi:hypothetical protein
MEKSDSNVLLREDEIEVPPQGKFSVIQKDIPGRGMMAIYFIPKISQNVPRHQDSDVEGDFLTEEEEENEFIKTKKELMAQRRGLKKCEHSFCVLGDLQGEDRMKQIVHNHKAVKGALALALSKSQTVSTLRKLLVNDPTHAFRFWSSGKDYGEFSIQHKNDQTISQFLIILQNEFKGLITH